MTEFAPYAPKRLPRCDRECTLLAPRRRRSSSSPVPRCPEEQIAARTLTLDDFAGLSILEAGEMIRQEPVEHAVIYTPAGRPLVYAASRQGSPDRVTIPLWKARLIRGNVFVHNHPEGQSFSAEDIWILLRHGARRVDVYGPARSFQMIASAATRRYGYQDELQGWAELNRVYWNAVTASDARFQRFVEARLLSDADAWVAHTHSVLRQLAGRFRFTYREIRL